MLLFAKSFVPLTLLNLLFFLYSCTFFFFRDLQLPPRSERDVLGLSITRNGQIVAVEGMTEQDTLKTSSLLADQLSSSPFTWRLELKYQNYQTFRLHELADISNLESLEVRAENYEIFSPPKTPALRRVLFFLNFTMITSAKWR